MKSRHAKIKRVSTRRGIGRYSISFPTGMTVEFLVEEPPKDWPEHGWQACFLRGTIKACEHLLRYLEPRKEKP